MPVIIKHAKTDIIADWTQAQLDEQIAAGNYPPGTTLADIVLPSDWNNDHTLTGVGTMAEQDANNVAITGGTATLSSVTTPSVTATTTDLTLSAISTGKINLNTATANQVQITDATAALGQYTLLSRDNTGNEQRISANSSSGGVNFGISSAVAGAVKFYTNGFSELQAQVSRTASAVNYVQVTGAATTTTPVISAQGSDSNIGLRFAAKGAGGSGHRFFGNSAATEEILRMTSANAAVNYHNFTSSASTFAPTYSVAGNDTNISMAFQPKGTGAIDLAAGSRGVNISNGGTVTAITVTNGGATAYTSHPTPAITAPTTAGGVQAVATSNLFYNSALASTTIVNGGTGYTVGNLLTVVGGTSTATAQFTVSAVSSGVVTAITGASGGTYSAIPTGTLSVTGGSGTGFTFTINGWAVRSLNITNAGSGYIEQPTITFSGGGGSGASAYATVGSGTTVKTLGSSISFNVPSSEVLRLSDGSSAACYLNLQSSSTTIQGFASSSGSNVGYQWVTKGVSNHSFATNNSVSTEQMRVSHTASAVNYVQVTGAATGGSVVISSQGSDANVGLQLRSRGAGDINLMTAGGNNQAVVRNTGNGTNFLGLRGGNSGVAPSISSDGGDTNIDLTLTPKGTGLVRFGTYVAGALTATGYINIKAADGTTYKVLVST